MLVVYFISFVIGGLISFMLYGTVPVIISMIISMIVGAIIGLVWSKIKQIRARRKYIRIMKNIFGDKYLFFKD